MILQKRSVEYSARLSLEKSIIMAQLWTDLKIPLEFSDFSQWPEPSKSEIFVYNTVQEGGNILNRLRLCFPPTTSILSKTKIIYYLLFPPADEMRARYHLSDNQFLPLYYVKRWYYTFKRK
jgi:hypothetical protein